MVRTIIQNYKHAKCLQP